MILRRFLSQTNGRPNASQGVLKDLKVRSAQKKCKSCTLFIEKSYHIQLGANYRPLKTHCNWGKIITFCGEITAFGGKVLFGVIVNNWRYDYHFLPFGARFYWAWLSTLGGTILTTSVYCLLYQLFMLWQTIDVANRLEAFSSLLRLPRAW